MARKIKQIVKTPVITEENDMVLSLPATVHIELTSSCCFGCRHCYNFWRQKKAKPVFMSKEKLGKIIDELLKNNIMHIIFTGGEPFLNNEVLLSGIRKLKESGISVTCNSTLAVCNSEAELKEMKEAGLAHILTSLNSHKPEVNDYLLSQTGAQKKVIAGIRNAVAAGIRISVNMIISQDNINDIYPTAELAYKLGAQKFFGTRVVPHLDKLLEQQKEFLIWEKEARQILNALMEVEKDFSIQVGTLIPFPFCFMQRCGGLERYARFYSHGCPAGNKMISLNADGNAHACVHEEEGYGNIFEIGIQGVWRNMKKWRSGELFPQSCKICPKFDDCNGGCRLCALAYKNSISAEDNLRLGLTSEDTDNSAPQNVHLNLDGIECIVPDGLRFRKEDGFYMVDRFGSEILCVKDEVASILKKYHGTQEVISPGKVGLNDSRVVTVLLKEKLLEQRS